MVAMIKMAVAVLVLAGCSGAVAEDATPDAGTDAQPEAAARVAANPDCLETDRSIQACIRAGAAGSWTAPGTCLVNFAPGKPQKLTADGVVERQSPWCCGFVQTEGEVALCCADMSLCMGDGGS